jgi:predicted amidophosphoribosyltransferase
MQCASCGFENQLESQFCEECGTKLVRACPRCNREVRSSAKFCPARGTPLAGQAGVASPQLPTPTPRAGAEACFHKALDIGHKQQAKSLELWAATNLAHLWQQQGRKEEARQLLAEIYG